MLKFILRKMISKKWLFIALLIGNILLVSIAASNPMYSQAVMQRMLSDNLEEYLETKNQYPGMVSYSFSGSVKRNGDIENARLEALAIPERFGVEELMSVKHYFLGQLANEPDIQRDDAKQTTIMLGTMEELDKHIKIIAGRMYEDGVRDDGVVEVIVSQSGLVNLNLLLGEKRTFKTIYGKDKGSLTIEVVGVFDAADVSDLYWVRTPSSFRAEALMDEKVFRSLFMQENNDFQGVSGTFYLLLDYERMRSDNAEKMNVVADELKAYAKDISHISVNISFANIITEHLATARKVTVTLWVLQVPMFALLMTFIFMVSRQILETEESEIAVLKSRGVKNRQVVGVYLLQSLLLALAALALGLPLGSFLTKVLGSASAFLTFVSRRALPVETGFDAILYALAAALVSVLAMVLPVVRFTRATIVTQKQKKHRRARPFWQKFFLDFLALGVSLYGLYSFNNQKEFLAQQILDGAVPDPLLFLCSSLFIIGAGLVAIRLIPLPIALIYRIFRKRWSPALYASYLKVLRQRNNQGFIMIFLVMTIALGVFNAQTARSINDSAEQNTRYLTGADIVLKEIWQSNSDEVAEDSSLDLIYYEPDEDVYETLPGVEATAKVFVNNTASVSVSGGSIKNVTFMGIDTDDFGRSAWFDTSLLPVHWYNYLNAMAQNARAVLVSKNFMTERGYKVGDPINYTVANVSARGIIYGFVEYFPSFAPYTYSKSSDGVYRETENWLVVGNLSQVQDTVGVQPYEVWIKTNDGGDGVYAFLNESGRDLARFSDTEANIIEKKNEPMLKSLNGVLTVSFIVTLLICFIGFLIYWILSIRQRTLLFGIYRAMGMTMREIFTMLINEQICISLTSIAAGALIGQLASRLYMPLIQLAYASSDTALKLNTAVNMSDTVRLLAIVGVMLFICMCVLVTLIRRMKISQALKLGED